MNDEIVKRVEYLGNYIKGRFIPITFWNHKKMFLNK